MDHTVMLYSRHGEQTRKRESESKKEREILILCITSMLICITKLNYDYQTAIKLSFEYVDRWTEGIREGRMDRHRDGVGVNG